MPTLLENNYPAGYRVQEYLPKRLAFDSGPVFTRQYIYPRYVAATVIHAVRAVTGYVDPVGGQPIQWMDMNTAGRYWKDLELHPSLILTADIETTFNVIENYGCFTHYDPTTQIQSASFYPFVLNQDSIFYLPTDGQLFLVTFNADFNIEGGSLSGGAEITMEVIGYRPDGTEDVSFVGDSFSFGVYLGANSFGQILGGAGGSLSCSTTLRANGFSSAGNIGFSITPAIDAVFWSPGPGGSGGTPVSANIAPESMRLTISRIAPRVTLLQTCPLEPDSGITGSGSGITGIMTSCCPGIGLSTNLCLTVTGGPPCMLTPVTLTYNSGTQQWQGFGGNCAAEVEWFFSCTGGSFVLGYNCSGQAQINSTATGVACLPFNVVGQIVTSGGDICAPSATLNWTVAECETPNTICCSVFVPLLLHFTITGSSCPAINGTWPLTYTSGFSVPIWESGIIPGSPGDFKILLICRPGGVWELDYMDATDNINYGSNFGLTGTCNPMNYSGSFSNPTFATPPNPICPGITSLSFNWSLGL
jgi:hypothetical protein